MKYTSPPKEKAPRERMVSGAAPCWRALESLILSKKPEGLRTIRIQGAEKMNTEGHGKLRAGP